MAEVRLATEADFRSFFEREPPPLWNGVVAVENGRPVAFGMVKWDDEGRAWGSVDAAAAVSRYTLHRTALRMLAALKEAGEPKLYAWCHAPMPGAVLWLRRLGFLPDLGLRSVVCAGLALDVWACTL